MILGATLLVSAITFITVEIRFRPHLYKWDSSRYVRSMISAVAKRPDARRTARRAPAPAAAVFEVPSGKAPRDRPEAEAPARSS
jgi:hypothetical protein